MAPRRVGRRTARAIAVQLGQQALAAPQHPHVRAKDLIRGTGQEIAAERRHLDLAVRRELHGVDINQRARRLGDRGKLGDRIDRSRQIARMGQGHQACAFVDQGAQVVRLDPPAVAIEPQPAHRGALVPRLAQPGRDIPLVVHAGDDDLVARAPVMADGAGDVKRQRGHRLTQHDLPAVRRSQQIGHGVMGGVIDRAAHL